MCVHLQLSARVFCPPCSLMATRRQHQIGQPYSFRQPVLGKYVHETVKPCQSVIVVELIEAERLACLDCRAQLGVKPSAACTQAPPAPTLDIAVKNIFCSTTNIVKQLETALGLGLPPAQQTAIQYDIAQLSNSFSSIEAGLIKFLFNIKC